MPQGEKELIGRIRRRTFSAAKRSRSVTTGIGDDAAVLRLPRGHDLLVTTDFSLENVHFRRDWHPPEVVGWRCLARGLSDIAAMGGEPCAAFLSLAAASDVPQRWIDQFLKGLLSLAKKFHVPLAGGDTAEAILGIQADIVVTGTVPRGTAVLRSGAKAGDLIYVTGQLGGSAADLSRLEQSLPVDSPRYFRPLPRLGVGQWLRQRRIPSAMIDISDGLSTDLQHICEESGCRAEIDAKSIPREVSLDLALHGGDDYELLFTSQKRVPAKVEGVRIARIGQITRGRGMWIIDVDGTKKKLEPMGWEHFRN